MSNYQIIVISDKEIINKSFTNQEDFLNAHIAYSIFSDLSIANIVPSVETTKHILIMSELTSDLVYIEPMKDISLSELEDWIKNQEHLHKLRGLK